MWVLFPGTLYLCHCVFCPVYLLIVPPFYFTIFVFVIVWCTLDNNLHVFVDVMFIINWIELNWIFKCRGYTSRGILVFTKSLSSKLPSDPQKMFLYQKLSNNGNVALHKKLGVTDKLLSLPIPNFKYIVSTVSWILNCRGYTSKAIFVFTRTFSSEKKSFLQIKKNTFLYQKWPYMGMLLTQKAVCLGLFDRAWTACLFPWFNICQLFQVVCIFKRLISATLVEFTTDAGMCDSQVSIS